MATMESKAKMKMARKNEGLKILRAYWIVPATKEYIPTAISGPVFWRDSHNDYWLDHYTYDGALEAGNVVVALNTGYTVYSSESMFLRFWTPEPEQGQYEESLPNVETTIIKTLQSLREIIRYHGLNPDELFKRVLERENREETPFSRTHAAKVARHAGEFKYGSSVFSSDSGDRLRVEGADMGRKQTDSEPTVGDEAQSQDDEGRNQQSED